MKIKKGVILAAGLGTRMMPITKSIPKSLIPVVDKPTIDYIVEEALNSGITELVIVCNHQAHVLKDYYKGTSNIHFIYQNNTFGTAYALASAKEFIGNDDFALFLGDEIVHSFSEPCILQLMNVFSNHPNKIITAIESTSKDLLCQYNVLSIDRTEVSKIVYIKEIIEKPPLDSFFPSSYTSIGRYVIPNAFLTCLSNLPNQPEEELPLTKFFNNYASKENFIGYFFHGKRFDIGTKDKWLKSNFELAKILGFDI